MFGLALPRDNYRRSNALFFTLKKLSNILISFAQKVFRMPFSKYLVSQHFGRIAASVTLNDIEKSGHLHLLAEGPKALDIEFAFSVNDVLPLTGQAEDIVDQWSTLLIAKARLEK